MVRLLLDMKAALDEVLNQAFQKSETFGHALKDAFEHFINQRANRWGLLLWSAVQRRALCRVSVREVDNLLFVATLFVAYERCACANGLGRRLQGGLWMRYWCDCVGHPSGAESCPKALSELCFNVHAG